MSESSNILVVFFPTKPRLILKPENPTKSSESRKNHMAECQAHKTALESVDQSQECRMGDSKRHTHNKALETLQESHRCKQDNLK